MRLRDWITLGPVFGRCLFKLPPGHLWYMARQLRYEMPHRCGGRLYINTFFPPVPSKAFDRFLDSVVRRLRIPYSTYFAVTDQCPFKCPHCSYGIHQKGRMDTPQALRAIEQIKSIGTITLGLTGGEPLLREDLPDLVAAAGDELETILFTTGHRLTLDRAKKLADARLGCMMIGMESDRPHIHNKVRGLSGSFTEGIRAIRISLDAGLYTAISTVATKEKIDGGTIERMAKMGARLGVHEFRILEPVPTGGLSGQTDEILSAEQSKRLADFHKRWNRRNRGPAVSAFSHLESDAMFGCGAGFHHLFIDAVGNVCPCDLTPLSFGNLLEEPLEEIWRRMGQTFSLPRRGCLMKDLCEPITKCAKDKPLPLSPEESIRLCRQVPAPEELPEIYKRLLKAHTPTNPPSSRP